MMAQRAHSSKYLVTIISTIFMEWKLKMYNQIKEIYLQTKSLQLNQSYFTTTGLQDCGSTSSTHLICNSSTTGLPDCGSTSTTHLICYSSTTGLLDCGSTSSTLLINLSYLSTTGLQECGSTSSTHLI